MTELALASSLAQRVTDAETNTVHLYERTEAMLDALAALAANQAALREAVEDVVSYLGRPTRWQRIQAWIKANVYDGTPSVDGFIPPRY